MGFLLLSLAIPNRERPGFLTAAAIAAGVAANTVTVEIEEAAD
jgi:hypothetical protein